MLKLSYILRVSLNLYDIIIFIKLLLPLDFLASCNLFFSQVLVSELTIGE